MLPAQQLMLLAKQLVLPAQQLMLLAQQLVLPVRQLVLLAQQHKIVREEKEKTSGTRIIWNESE